LPTLHKIWDDEEVFRYFKLSPNEIEMVKNAHVTGYKELQKKSSSKLNFKTQQPTQQQSTHQQPYKKLNFKTCEPNDNKKSSLTFKKNIRSNVGGT